MRTLQLKTRLDPPSHGVLQLAMMAFLRDATPSMGIVEDLRLALDEVLLDGAITEEMMVTLDVSHDTRWARVEVTIDHPDIAVDTHYLDALVDHHTVERTPTVTRVILQREWRVD